MMVSLVLIINQIADIMISAQTIGNVVEKQFGCTSLTTVIQDGPQAGQTVTKRHHHMIGFVLTGMFYQVPHVHMHVIPRKKGDWANNDDIYEELGGKNKVRVDNEEREPRSAEEMKKEAEWLRTFFPDNFNDMP